ncbi:right-handed parallel beta-helix repeat-containing protein [Klebsiella variicola]|uniref:right-handed parallel beta-helix repeat-containing protein n=1 Tax=Klebsiella variicola TaxID=244366 RepID=UPI00280B3616|nr:right-handed parallel beta-helix repeat-containing protein [Klebsiella variicola]
MATTDTQQTAQYAAQAAVSAAEAKQYLLSIEQPVIDISESVADAQNAAAAAEMARDQAQGISTSLVQTIDSQLSEQETQFESQMNTQQSSFESSQSERASSFEEKTNEFESRFSSQLSTQESTFSESQTDKENRFQQFLLSSGYVFLGDYENGPWQFSARNQYIRYDGQYWRLASTAPSNFTTTGVTASTFEVDKLNLVAMDSDVLRQELTGSSGAELVSYSFDKQLANIRSLQSRLNDAASILDFASDSAYDDSSRFAKAIAAGVTSIYIPNAEVLTREIGRAYLLVKNVDIPLNLLIWGNGKAGFRQIGGPVRVRDDADYGFYFCGTGNGTTAGVRVIGGGLVGISMQGQTTANKSTFVKVLHASSMEFNNVSMRNGGTAFYLQDFMESRIINCYFNSIGSETSNVIHIGDYVDAAPWNVNNLHIENCIFGSNSGHWVYISDSANADLIWIQGNKFEWDSTPTNANSTNKSVIYAGRVERLYVVNNGFVYFYPSHNMYDTILKVGAAAAYGIQFLGNTAWGCENAYFWQILGGSVLARDNRSNTQMNVLTSSIHSQDIEQPLIRAPTGNRPPSYFAKRHDVNFIPSHYLTGASASNNFTVDSDAVLNGTCQLAAVSTELRRAVIPKDMVAAGRVIKVTARCKNTNDTDAQIRLICDSSTVINYNSSLDDQATYLKIPAGSGWANYSWYLTPAMIANGGWMIITNASTTTFLFDGVSIEYANNIDLTVPWSASSIAANTTSNTSVYMSKLGPYIKGVSMPKTDNALGGAIATAYFDGSTNNLWLQAARVGSTVATVAATSFTIRVFLK